MHWQSFQEISKRLEGFQGISRDFGDSQKSCRGFQGFSEELQRGLLGVSYIFNALQGFLSRF